MTYSQWQPIETAPKTSKSRLIWCPERKNIYCVVWADEGWACFGVYGEMIHEEPTHWMPLPEPPVSP